MNLNNNLKISSLILIMSNMALVYGVYNHNFTLFTLMFVYWSENLIIGIFNVFKILLIKETVVEANPLVSKVRKLTSKVFVLPFFIVHYGVFTLVHGVFVFTLFSKYGFSWQSVFMGFLAVLASHTLSFFINYIGAKEFEKKRPFDLIFAPYKRVIFLHIILIAGGFIIASTNQTLLFLLAFAILKTIIDLFAHISEHKNIKTPVSIVT